MSLEQFASFSNYAVASATLVIALAWVAYLAQWALGRKFEASQRIEISELVPSGSGATTHPPPDNDAAFRSEMASRIGLSLTVLGWLILLAAVVTRALAAQRVPWGNMYEFAITGSVIVIGAYLTLVKTSQIQWLGPILTGFALAVLGSSILVYVPAGPLVPALNSYWLYIHVAAAMIGGSGFLVGASASAFYLVKSRAEGRTPVDQQVGHIWSLPTSEAMDQLAYRANAFAFPVWTFAALIAGPIWAQYAWGRYWGWDPKEVWAFITWVIYAGYLHARVTAGWKGKAAAIIALVGFASFLFNFIGVNLFITGLHSYAK